MRRLAPILLVAAATAFLAAPSGAAFRGQGAAESVPAATPPAASPDRVIVAWAPGASPSERRAARAEADVDFSRDLGDRDFQLVETEPGQTPGEAVRELEADPAVALAERDWYLSTDAAPNDPLFGQLWGLQNSGLGINAFEGAVAGDDIDALGAWTRTIGSPATVVAVIDSGYRFEHADLANVAWTNPGEIPGNSSDDDGNGLVDDVHGADFVGASASSPTPDGDPTDNDPRKGGHGVHTAGTIGAEGNNGVGITGVAQDVSLMPLRVCARDFCPGSAVVEAVNYAGANGARVANISLGSDSEHFAVREAIAANPQTLFVISAGNSHADTGAWPHYPCVFNPLAEGKGPVDNVICVAATDQADQLAEFSNYGASTVDLGAPGTETLSTFPATYLVADDFELNDFNLKWTSGPGGGFGRTNEAPLTSFGIADTPGAPPDAGVTKESTSVPVAIPAGFEECTVEVTRRVSGNRVAWLDVYLDGELIFGFADNTSGRITQRLRDELSGGGDVSIHVEYNTAPNPSPTAGAWFDDIGLYCLSKVGEPGGYVFLQGTSMAAPHVTGTAALLLSMKPSASVTEVRRALLGSVDPVPSLAGKTTSGGRLDAGAATELFDSVPPPTPSLSATNPASPSKSNQPRLKGSAQRGTSIDVYASADCSGSPVATGTAAQLAAPGIAVTVGDATTTEFSVTATDMAPHTSPCSAPISYTEDSDIVPPAAPQLLGTDPPSPGSSGAPRIFGAAEAGSTVRLYTGPTCTGSPLATVTAAHLASPGISVWVAEGVTIAFSAKASDASVNTSACSAPISYTRLRATGPDDKKDGDPPPPPRPRVCVVPELNGKTLAQAKAALTAATCKLGTVRRPKPGKGKRQPRFVVRSSSPRAGVIPADDKVDLRLGKAARRTRR